MDVAAAPRLLAAPQEEDAEEIPDPRVPKPSKARSNAPGPRERLFIGGGRKLKIRVGG